jgi:AbrB family looped-hinge helix DNA binding protein
MVVPSSIAVENHQFHRVSQLDRLLCHAMSDTLTDEVTPFNDQVAPNAERPTTVDDMAEPAIGPVRIGPKGRVVLPAEARRQLGVDEGDELLVLVEDETIKLMTRETLAKEIQAMFADCPSSDDLIAERRIAAARERREMEEGW